MSDALCGPINPLQQFRKQALNNAPFSQDRLASQRPVQEVLSKLVVLCLAIYIES